MTYCNACGSEIPGKTKFCPECGAKRGGETEEQEDIKRAPETAVKDEEKTRFSLRMALVAGVMGLLSGFFAFWATLNLSGLSGPIFLVVFLGSSYFLYNKQIPSEAVGSGLYIVALLMILTPLIFYLTMIFSDQSSGLEGVGTLIGGILGLVIWGFVFFLFAIVTGGVGYYFKRRAEKKLS